jgi:hypothetical protein
MSAEISKFFNIDIDIEGKKTQQLLVTPDTLLQNIRNKIGENIELIYQGTILEDDLTLKDIGILDNNSTIYAFYTVDTKTHDLINIFQSIIETYTQPNDLPFNHYNNILNSIMNIHSTNNRNQSTNSDASANLNNNNYNNELESLRNLGFDNDAENILLLQLYNGNVDYVANLLLEQ